MQQRENLREQLRLISVRQLRRQKRRMRCELRLKLRVRPARRSAKRKDKSIRRCVSRNVKSKPRSARSSANVRVPNVWKSARKSLRAPAAAVTTASDSLKKSRRHSASAVHRALAYPLSTV